MHRKIKWLDFISIVGVDIDKEEVIKATTILLNETDANPAEAAAYAFIEMLLRNEMIRTHKSMKLTSLNSADFQAFVCATLSKVESLFSKVTFVAITDPLGNIDEIEIFEARDLIDEE